MVDHDAMQVALRTKLKTLLVCTTGAITLSATSTGYARTAGDFVADGFAPGMEVTPAGFAANPIATITAVAALTLTVSAARAAEGPAGARSLSVGLPSLRAWENVAVKRVQGQPYVEEHYLPGPMTLATAGQFGTLIAEPMYAPRVWLPAGVGVAAGNRYRSAMLRLFAPKTPIALPNGDVLRVRGDAAPYLGQRLVSEDSAWSIEPITIPLRCYTLNTI